MRKFKKGERARYVGSEYTTAPEYFKYLGQQVTVMRAYESSPFLPNAYTIKASSGEAFGVAEVSLRKLLPESDTYQKGSWDEFHKITKQPTREPAGEPA